jgi:phosphoglucomutase
MPSLPDGWRLKQKKRADGRVDIVGQDVTGSEYVARTTEGPGITDRDLQILSVGNRETSTARDVVKFYENERDSYRKNWEHSMDAEYSEAADKVVHAGLHLSESRCGYSRAYAAKWESVFGKENGHRN